MKINFIIRFSIVSRYLRLCVSTYLKILFENTTVKMYLNRCTYYYRPIFKENFEWLMSLRIVERANKKTRSFLTDIPIFREARLGTFQVLQTFEP